MEAIACRHIRGSERPLSSELKHLAIHERLVSNQHSQRLRVQPPKANQPKQLPISKIIAYHCLHWYSANVPLLLGVNCILRRFYAGAVPNRPVTCPLL